MTVRVAEPALTKTARLPSRLKMTLLRRVPARKFVPRIVSVSPTPSFIGATDEIVGSLDFFFVAADALPAGSTARHMSAQRARIASGRGGMPRSSGASRCALRAAALPGRIAAARASPHRTCSVQPLQVRRPGGGRPGTLGTAARLRDPGAVGERAARRGDARAVEGGESGRRHVAQLACLGRRVRRVPLPALTDLVEVVTFRDEQRVLLAMSSGCCSWRDREGRGIRRSGRRGSNPRPSAWEADALPTELRPRGARF